MILLQRLRASAAVLLALAAAGLAHAAGSVVSTDQVRAELLAHAPEGVAAGKPVWLALSIEHQRDWHTYWKNPGDSGLPTQLSWTLPEGVSAGEIAWPTPRKLPVGPLMNYGYEGRVLLAVPVTVPAGYAAGTLPVKLRADWLVCKDVCIPQSGDFSLDLPTQAATAANGALFEAAARAQPKPAPDAKASARVDGESLVVEAAALPAAWQGKAVDFLPEQANVIENAAPAKDEWQGGTWRLRMPLSSMRTESPERMQAVLALPGAESGLRVDFAVAGTWPPVPSLTPASTSPADAQAPAAATLASPPLPSTAAARPVDASLALALGLAFVGGLLLNLMPCVFPVLSLKLYGFAQHHHDRRQLFAGGLAYTAGVVVSVLALAGVLLALRAGGEQLGWGFQLQSPGFVAALALLFTLIGLNLLGVFELGHLLPSSLATARARHPLVDSALTGVIAVAVASPCTAPFMGASLGLALTLPAAPALAVFAALGLGMALPYLAVSAWPGLGRVMPRPGAWMARFRTLMAFPMFATVLWLVWVLGQQTGIDGATALLGLLLAVAFAAWALGSAGFGRGGRVGFGALGVLLVAAAASWALPSWRESAPAGSAAKAADAWAPWSAQRVAAANAEGRAVFVDFTAAWCVTCQVNKRSTLGNRELLADFERRGVLLMRADWTRRDAAIAAELSRLGRSGVPVYALYRPGEPMPQLLPEVLSVGLLREALASLPPAAAPGPDAGVRAASRTAPPTP